MFNNYNKNRLILFFEQFGCNKREAETYLTCLQLGPTPVKDIAHNMNSNRITTHSIIEQMIKKGFLYETFKGKKRLVGAENPTVLMSLLQKKYNDLKLLEINMDYIVRILSQSLPKTDVVPSVRFYEGIDGLKKVIEETLDAKNETLMIGNLNFFADLVDKDYLMDFHRRRGQSGIQTRAIFASTPMIQTLQEKNEEYRLNFKVIDGGTDWTCGILIWNDDIALAAHSDGRVAVTVIQNADLTNFFRNVVFESLWRLGHSPEFQ